MAEPVKHNPLHQFEVHPLFGQHLHIGGVDVSFTNSALFMVLAVAAASFFLIGGMRKKAMIPGRWQSLSELTYEFVAKMLDESAGEKARAFFPFIFTLFMFLLLTNLLGLLPYSFTVTSHIIVTFALAGAIFVAVTVVGFVKHGIGFLKFFVPTGVPLWLAPVMVLIELISYLMRPVTLAMRLAGNMMAGHVLLKVVAGFVIALIGTGALGWSVMSLLPFALLVLFTGFELLVALIQAYVFSLLVCIYLNDALNMH